MASRLRTVAGTATGYPAESAATAPGYRSWGGITPDDDDQDSAILTWLLGADGQVITPSADASALPAALIASTRDRRTVTTSLGQSGPYRFAQSKAGTDVLIIGISLAGDRRIERWLLIGEVTAGGSCCWLCSPGRC